MWLSTEMLGVIGKLYMPCGSELNLVLKLSMKLIFPNNKDFLCDLHVECLIFISAAVHSGFFPHQSFASWPNKISSKLREIICFHFSFGTNEQNWTCTEVLAVQNSTNGSECLQFKYHVLSWSTFQ